LNPVQDREADIDLALKACREVIEDPSTPAAARIAAARTILEVRAQLGRNQEAPAVTDDKPLATLSRAELEAELKALSS
jgi:hypothetical protein